MNHRAGLDRSQTPLFPERLEDYIAAENPVRFLDAFADNAVHKMAAKNNFIFITFFHSDARH